MSISLFVESSDHRAVTNGRIRIFRLLRSHDTLSNTLDKWSTKIQAAAAQQANLGKANTKFTNTAQIGVLEAIESGLGGRVSLPLGCHRFSESSRISISMVQERGADIWQDEDPAYKALLREVIESRSGSSAGKSYRSGIQWHSELMGVTFNQKELAFLPYRVKRRSVGMPSVAPAKGESSGGSQRPRATGRSATDVTHPVPRYTVHEKAQNFVVPIPLSNGWHQEQVDELFSSLLGGAGIEGAGADREDGLVMGVVSGTGVDVDSRENTEVSLSGLKVF